jgi:hypothetical protein
VRNATSTLFFVRLALISDDLRHLHHLMLHARVAIKASTNDIEKMLGMHQLMFALRIYYGTLNEAWHVIRTGWFGTKLSQKLDSSLPDEAQKALAALKRYFEHGDTLTETIRHNFAFHFVDESIKEALKLQLPEQYDGFVAGDNLANIFYIFAENVLFHAMLLRAGVTNIKDPEQIRSGVGKIYDEGLRVSDYFTAFANAIMVKIAKSLNVKVERFSTSTVTDFTTMQPTLFVDPEKFRELDNSSSMLPESPVAL